MPTQINIAYLKSFSLAFLAGVLWSFGALIVRHMADPREFRWQYLFFRGISIAIVILPCLVKKEGIATIITMTNINMAGVVAALGLVTAFVGFIWSITMTTVANSLFMLATTPFIAAFSGIYFRHERVSAATWTAMSVALTGVIIMVVEGIGGGHVMGNLTALMSAAGFAVFSVGLRGRKSTPKLFIIAFAGILCAAITAVIMIGLGESLIMPMRNIYLSMLHGAIVGVGLILYSAGARYLKAAELTLLSLVEIVFGIFWVYIPLFGIHEIPNRLSLVGGGIVLFAMMINGVGAGYRSPMSFDEVLKPKRT